MGVLTMSKIEIDRMHVIRDFMAQRVNALEAAQLMGVTRRHLFRLAKAWRLRGPSALVSTRRGKPSNRAFPAILRSEVLELIKTHYPDFGPTLAAEKLRERHNIALSVETVRQWMRADGIWLTRKQKAKPVHQPRYRRECVGELVQIDGSEHYWFEDRGPQCTLLVFIDDATSRLMTLRFVETESTFDYYAAARSYLEAYGKPVAFYSDKHAVFRVNAKEAHAGDGMAQFGRALNQLNIDIICANSSQARGRVERANGTLQDRLVKELRLAGISTLEDGNVFLLQFMADFNRRFAKEPLNSKDVHRPLRADESLDEVFAWKEERTLSLNLTLQYEQVIFIVEPNAITLPLARKRVTVYDYPDGRLAIKHNGLSLPYRTFDKRPQINPAAVVDNKRLGAVLSYISQKQAELDMSRCKKAPRRRGQVANIFTTY